MNNGRTYLHDGAWLTIKEVASLTGMSVRSLYDCRIGNRLDLTPKPRSSRARRYEFGGEMLTYAEIKARTGLSQATISRRRCGNRVLTDEELAAQPREHATAKPIFFDGKSYTIPQWSVITGIKSSTLHYRLYVAGWPVSRALTEPIHSRRVKAYTCNGQTLTLAEWAKTVGIGRYRLWERVVQYGWPLEQALTMPVNISRAELAAACPRSGNREE